MTTPLTRLWNRIHRFRSDADLEDELRIHLELNAEDNLALGMTVVEAARQARLRLGGTRAVVEAMRDQELLTSIAGWHQDFLLGARALRKTPVFCFTSILTIALGIGANTAVFSLLYGLLLRSLPVHNPQDLVHISLFNSSEGPDNASVLPYPTLEQLSKEQHSFTGISGWANESVAIRDSDGTLRLYPAGLTTGNGFSLLGLTPYLGRLIAPSDDVRGSPPHGWPVVLSYAFWKSHFAGDPRVLGKQITIWYSRATIVGVAPPPFHGLWPGLDPKVYLPLEFLNTQIRDQFGLRKPLFFCSAVARLHPGVSIAAAKAGLAVEHERLLPFIPAELQHDPYFEKATLHVASARTGLPTFFISTYSEPLFLLQLLVIIVLVLCSVNVSGLMLARIHVRLREFAVRTALGAPRWRLIRQYMAESLVIAAAGAVLGTLGAWYGNGLLLRFFRDPRLFEGMSVHPDHMVFLVTALLAVFSTLFFGTLPALKAGRVGTGILLKSRTSLAAGSRIGRAFVPAQMALALILVTLATLFSQSLAQLRSRPMGFDASHVTIQTPPFNQLSQKGDARLDLYQQMVDRIQQMPGVQSAALTWYTPVTGEQSTLRVRAFDGTSQPVQDARMAYNDVGPGYFATMKTAILSGREFNRKERRRNVCVLNQSAARYLFPHGGALDAYVTADRDSEDLTRIDSCRVVGIAADAVFASLREPPPRTIYFPITVDDSKNFVFLINSATKAQAVAAYSAALKEIAPSIPVVLFATMQEQVDAELGTQRLITALSNLFAILALFLSALGLYGLLAASIAQRTGEIGVRMALGARPSAVLRMVLREASGLVGAGALIGMGGAALILPFVKHLLFDVSAHHPASIIAIALPLTAVALIAASLPARRAASIDPLQALRVE